MISSPFDKVKRLKNPPQMFDTPTLLQGVNQAIRGVRVMAHYTRMAVQYWSYHCACADNIGGVIRTQWFIPHFDFNYWRTLSRDVEWVIARTNFPRNRKPIHLTRFHYASPRVSLRGFLRIFCWWNEFFEFIFFISRSL